MKPDRFKGILKNIGQAYLSSENMSVNSMRTVVGTLVMAECSALGIRMDDPIVKDFASSILSPVKVCTSDFVVFICIKIVLSSLPFVYVSDVSSRSFLVANAFTDDAEALRCSPGYDKAKQTSPERL